MRTLTIKQNLGGEQIIVVYCDSDCDFIASKVYSELDFGVAQAIEDFLATGEVSEYSN